MRSRDENELLLYYRHFLQISNPLRLSNQLSDEVRNAEFFNGFHPKDQDIIYDRLFAIDPRRPLNQTPSIDDTWEAAHGYFTNNQFHLRMSRDAFEDSSSFSNNHLTEQWFRKEAQDPQQHSQHSQHDCNFYHRPTSHLLQDVEHINVGDLVYRMYSLSTQDAMYAALYAQCMQRFPEIAKHLAMPDMFYPSPSAFTLQASNHAHSTALTPNTSIVPVHSSNAMPFQHDAPPHAVLSFEAIQSEAHLA